MQFIKPALLSLILVSTSFAQPAPLDPVESALAEREFPSVWAPPFFNGIAAEVGSEIITYDDIRSELRSVSAQLDQQGVDEATYTAQMKLAYKDVLRALVDRQLLINDFDSKGYKIPPNEIDYEYNRTLSQKYDGKISNLADELQKRGLSLDNFKTDLTNDLKVQYMQRRFTRNLPPITPDQIKVYYDAHPGDFASAASVHIATITLKPLADEPAPVVVQQASDIKTQIEGGADFAELARTNSTDSNAENGGDWGWVALNDIQPGLQSALGNLLPGEISEPIVLDPTSSEVILAKMIERKDHESLSLEQATPSIENILRRELARTTYNEMMHRLRSKNFIQIH